VSFSVESRELAPELVSMRPLESGAPLSRGRAFTLLEEEPALRRAVLDALRDLPFEAFFWECVPVSRATGREEMSWIVQNTRSLAGVAPDTHSFREELPPGEGVSCFRNLGGDALLVAPGPGDDPAARAHLASFVRGAPPAQVEALFATVGRETASHLSRSDAPVWVSTSGLGVYWLHVRLDRRPKYYTHAPYRRAP